MGIARGDPKYNQWAVDLMETMHHRFVHRSITGFRMFWKMSVDLSRPLVPSEGNLDPYDGLVTTQ